ncbi:MAG: putative lipid II flippase FtsW [Firmicutes bacterium]|nr:putative lipid II flippase FtsW [Bacillota bacterium]
MNKLPAEKNRGGIDWWLLCITLALTSLGIIMVFSASQYFASYYPYNDTFYFLKKQAFAALLGFIGMAIAANFPYEWIKKLTLPGFVCMICLFTLMLVLRYAGAMDDSGGAFRWLEVGSFSFQPSEFAKFLIPLTVAFFLSQFYPYRYQKGRYYGYPLAAIVLASGMILGQRDLSTAFVVAVAGVLMLFVAGLDLKYVVGVGLGGGGVIALAIMTVGYRSERIMAWLDPWNPAYTSDATWQITQSLMALGNGGLTGVGLGSGGSKWYYLPARHTDFIFSVWAEEMGFLGGMLIIVLFALFIWRGMIIAIRTPDMYGSLAAMGLTASIGFQAFVNLGVVTGVLPVTGVTLPFISYGGTSLVISLGIVGLLLNISRLGNRGE